MGNEEHLARLKQGVEAWNGWRSKNPGIQPDLFRADLTGVDLRQAKMQVYDLPAGTHTFAARMSCQSVITVFRGWLTVYELPAIRR